MTSVKHTAIRRRRSAKIVATIGPASSSPEVIEQLFLAGVDVFRLNFSHGTHDDHMARLETIRRVERDHGRPIGVMMDLQGPKLRVGRFAGGAAQIRAGKRFRFDLDPAEGNADRATLPHPEIFAAIDPGTELLVDDGKLRLRVDACGPSFADVTVVTGGRISDHKGVNVPNVVLPISALTEKDRADLAFGLDLGVDWVAMSFVQRPEDVAEGRKLIGGRAALLVKLEKPLALENLEEIMELCDGVMVARGDLGVESPPEDVPVLQRRIVHLAREAGKPVIVATQMLESMINAPTPTRAEASDVATAIYEGADAVMLSAETAAGSYPLEAVTFMDRMLCRVQSDPLFQSQLEAGLATHRETASDAITAAAKQVAATVRASAIVTYTTSGSTTLRAARERPDVAILCLTSMMGTARRMALVWGVHAVHTKDVSSFADMVQKACRIAHAEGFAESGERIVITAGVPFGTPGATNILRIAWVHAHG
ncbi:MAG TPA: pyruvate kinase [Stellaceae bacterium]|nr:pyruvate kinase [Stellaceae bacterium]